MDTKLRCFWNWRTKKERRKFSREFKIEAVKLVRERGVKVRRPLAIWTCMRQYCAVGFGSLPGIRVRPFPAMAR